MAYENFAMDTAARFGEIPFAAFTSDLIHSTFQTLVDSQVEQMQEYQNYTQALTSSLSTYINNTVDSVSMSDIQGLLSNIPLPSDDGTKQLLDAIAATSTTFSPKPPATALTAVDADPTVPTSTTPVSGGSGNAITAIIGALSPAVKGLVDGLFPKKENMNADNNYLTAYLDMNHTVLAEHQAALNVSATAMSGRNLLYRSLAATVASNKYALLQNMASMGLLRLIVSDGQIETKITFSTWESHSDGSSTEDKKRDVAGSLALNKSGILGSIFGKNKAGINRTRTVAVSTAKTWHQDSSGSSVNIFGHVRINFKTDYLPLNR